ncbi:hypothetical protein Ancab_026881 [Ancistrocladus abbreviatus]
MTCRKLIRVVNQASKSIPVEKLRSLFKGLISLLSRARHDCLILPFSNLSITYGGKMSYDDVEIEDMEWNEELLAYTYPCPCGDLFQITKDDLRLGEEIATLAALSTSLLSITLRTLLLINPRTTSIPRSSSLSV